MGLNNITNLGNFTSVNDFNEVFKQSQSSIGDFKLGIEKTVFNDNTLKNDKELSSDLKLLMNQGQGAAASHGTSDANNLSADKAYNTFSDTLKNSISSLNNTQLVADKAMETFATGGNIDVHQVMLASRKATLSMEMAMKMQSKIVQAYQELSRMSV